MTGLQSLQVVDLSHGIAGPLVGMFLADFGAEVIKIEPPGGDPTRESPGFSMWNRGKKSAVVDGADVAQCRWLGDLIAGADICIVKDEATLEQFGLTRAGLMARNARLIVSSFRPMRAARRGSASMNRRRCSALPAASPGGNPPPMAGRSIPSSRICSMCRACGERSAPSRP